MIIEYLHSDELDYELAVRGYPTDGTVAEKRKRLRPALRLEKDGVSFSSSLVLNFGDELRVCADKVAELQEATNQFDFSKASSEYKRFRTRLLHILGRLKHITDPEYDATKGQLLVKCGEISDFLEETILLLQPIQVPQFPTLVPPEVETPTSTTTTASTGAGSVADIAQSSPNHSRNNSLIDVDPKDLESTILNLQLNSSSVQATVTPVTQTITTTNAPGGNVFPTTLPPVVFSQPFFGIPDPALRAVPHGTFPMYVQSMPSYPALLPTGNTSQPTASTAAANVPSLRTGTLSDAVQPGIGQSRRVSFAGVPDESIRDAQGCLAESRFGFSDNARVFKTVSQWNLKFDGLTGLNTFLRSVEELRVACGFSKSQLLSVAVVLFRGVALDWVRANVEPSHTWDDLVRLLKTAFLPGEYEEDIWADIRARTQGQHERTTAYIAVMQNLFNKLSEKPSEQTKLRIIRRNLLPYIQSQLALLDCTTISELSTACQRVEDAQARIERFKPPPTNPSLVTEQDLMYNPRRCKQQVSAVVAPQGTHSSQTGLSGSPSTARTGSTAQHCWNCGQKGHMKRDCTRPRSRHCFSCGEPNVTKASCPKCAGNAGLAR